MACLAILEGPIWIFFPLFLLDVPMRETSIYLVLVSFPFFLQRWGWKRAAATSFALAAAWLRHPPADRAPLRAQSLRDRTAL